MIGNIGTYSSYGLTASDISFVPAGQVYAADKAAKQQGTADILTAAAGGLATVFEAFRKPQVYNAEFVPLPPPEDYQPPARPAPSMPWGLIAAGVGVLFLFGIGAVVVMRRPSK